MLVFTSLPHNVPGAEMRLARCANFQTMSRYYAAALLLLLPVLNRFLPYNASQQVEFQLAEDSRLYIKGTSNVTDFTCHCLESFPKATAKITENGSRIQFAKTALQIRTKKLDCGNKPMNNDMYNTLKANDYPHIQMTLIETRRPAGSFLQTKNSWTALDATLEITIAGVTRKELVPVQGRKTDADAYHFKGTKTLLMTNYGLKPPRALMGLIKVSDEIIIELDLRVHVLAAM